MPLTLPASAKARPLKGLTTGPRDDLVPKSRAPDINEPAEALSTISNDLRDQTLLDARPHKRRRADGTDDTSALVEPVTVISTSLSADGPLRQVSPECKSDTYSLMDTPLSLMLTWVGSLSGDVFKLSIDDLKEIARSDQVGSDVFLTWPLVLQTAPFITAPVSNALALQFASRCSHLKGMS